MAEQKKTQALELLSGILEETQREAEEERRKADEARRTAEEQARRDALAEAEAKRHEAERKLAEEDARRAAAAERRAAAAEALRIEELRAKGLYKEPEEEKPAAAPAAAKAPVEEKRSSLPLLLAALVLGGLAVGAWFGYQEMNREYVDASTSYSYTAPATVALAAAGETPVAFRARPVVEEVVEEQADSGRSGRRSGRTSSRDSDSATPPSDSGRRGLQLRGGISDR